MKITMNLARIHYSDVAVKAIPVLAARMQQESALAHILGALARLPEKDRAALHLFYGEGLTAREIGAITGEKEASVRSRLSRARAQLRKEWEGGA